jgi:hypothetical protein
VTASKDLPNLASVVSHNAHVKRSTRHADDAITASADLSFDLAVLEQGPQLADRRRQIVLRGKTSRGDSDHLRTRLLPVKKRQHSVIAPQQLADRRQHGAAGLG